MSSDPYNPEKFGGIQLSIPSSSRPTEDAAPAAIPEAPPEDRAARVRMRLKGSEDGPVYQGQTIIVPCINCGRK